jgi:lysozyme
LHHLIGRCPAPPAPGYAAAVLLALPLGAHVQLLPTTPHRAVTPPVTVATRSAPSRTPHGEGPYRLTPERKALLNTIRYAEGTWQGGSAEGYRMLYGGERFQRLDRHPEITVRRRYVSAAAGAYQFLPDTWKEAANKLRLRDFAPPSQDQAALYLVEKRGALGAFDRQGLTPEVLHRLAPEWASLPTRYGSSHYGQPVKQAEELRRFYLAELRRQQRSAAA